MPFDPFSWAIGYGLSSAANAGRKAIAPNKLRKQLITRIEEWARGLAVGGLHVEPGALFQLSTDVTSGTEEPGRSTLKSRLQDNIIPSKGDWSDAILERWREIRLALGESAQSFFTCDERIAEKKIAELSAILHQECVHDSQMFQTTVMALLDGAVLASDSAIDESVSKPLNQCSLHTRLHAWFDALGYSVEGMSSTEVAAGSWMLNVPRRRGFDRIVVFVAEGEADASQLKALEDLIDREAADEGWLVADMRVSAAVRDAATGNALLYCYTFDELIDEDTGIDDYLEWLGEEISQLKIDSRFISLGCRKREIDSEGKSIAVSSYDAKDGGVEAYIDRWLDDPGKEHLSILGEFGTGKTWLVLHYAWVLSQRYRDARDRGVARPRLPIIVPLRDYARSVSLTSLLSEFFFRRHNTRIRSYKAFECLNRLGKIALLFDGFDEMSVRIDRQKMINNFWEIATAAVPGAKVLLTCRTEHFPDAYEGRALLGAELKAATTAIGLTAPQFEILELNKFEPWQVRQCLLNHVNASTADRLLEDTGIKDLLRRPLMIELLVEALPDIEKPGAQIDISRVYLFAVHRKLARDVKTERTFTSIADKVYFMCEVSWKMLSTDSLSLNFRQFPNEIRELFGGQCKSDPDLDHWQYDMSGQTMLVRDEDGNYSPAHRSLVEFFAAYKLAAQLGILSQDFMACIWGEASNENAVDVLWSELFASGELTGVRRFLPERAENFAEVLGHWKLTDGVVTLLRHMTDGPHSETIASLISLLQGTAALDDPGLLGANIVAMLLSFDRDCLEGADLSSSVLDGARFAEASGYTGSVSLRGAVFRDCSLIGAQLLNGDLRNVDFRKANLQGVSIPTMQMDGCSIHPDGRSCVISSHEGLTVWSFSTASTIRKAVKGAWDATHDPSGATIAVSGWNCFRRYSTANLDLIGTYDLEIPANQDDRGSELSGEPDNGWATAFAFTRDGKRLYVGSNNGMVFIWDLVNGKQVAILRPKSGCVRSIALNQDESMLGVSCYGALTTWDTRTRTAIARRNWTDCDDDNSNSSRVDFDRNGSAVVTDQSRGSLLLLDPADLSVRSTIPLSFDPDDFCLSPDGAQLFTVASNSKVTVIALPSGEKSKELVITHPDSGSRHLYRKCLLDFSAGVVVLASGESIYRVDVATGEVLGALRHFVWVDGMQIEGTLGLSPDVVDQLIQNGAVM